MKLELLNTKSNYVCPHAVVGLTGGDAAIFRSSLSSKAFDELYRTIYVNMAAVRDSFVDLERRRLQLEQNVAKLQSSLRHWQTWEIEYEGMKEEILALGENPSQAVLVDTSD